MVLMALCFGKDHPEMVFGSATFLDITNDGINDVIIAGRSTHY